MSEGVNMTAPPPPSSSHLQNMLQRAVQTVKWTYSIYWKLCPLQRILVWSGGYYNGEIKTRKTVQLKEVSAEEASLHRSQQLRELYETLCAGGCESNHQTRRPSAALSPEDLTEPEWFYLMCLSYYFPPAVGLPGRAYAKRQHVWLTGANEVVDTQIFPRAILAKSAKIQTVVCIPLLEGVVELGTTQKVREDLRFVQQIINFFIQSEESQSQEPALSEQSTSNPPNVSGFCPSSTGIKSPAAYITISPHVAGTNHSEKDQEAEDDEEGEDDEEDAESSRDSEALSFNDVIYSPLIQNPNYVPNDDIRIGSIDGGSNDDMDSDYLGRWPYGEEDPQINISHFPLSPPAQEEDTHYSQTVAIILQGQSSRCSDISTATSYIHHSPHSAFFKWSSSGSSAFDHLISGPFSQRKLKYILFSVPLHHSKDNNGSKKSSAFKRASRLHKAGTNQEVLIGGANNVLAERRRREKLNERFITLRSLVPFVTKMDKASILGDTIEYVKQLRKKIQELEAREKQIEDLKENNVQVNKEQKGGVGGQSMIKKKTRLMDSTGNGGGKLKAVTTGNEMAVVHVEVSIIENNVLVKLQCRHREGLLLDIMQILRLFRVEITSIQSSLSKGFFMAELRAKVKDNLNGKKVTIMEVKKAILQAVSSQ